MSTASQSKRKGKSSHLHLMLPANVASRPPISALFLVSFDVKAGYTISWKRCVAGLELDDSVEFKSLPSGLHNVAEDLVYFVHDDQYAGVSAFVNKLASTHQRGARMLAVGALIPLDNGRLGRSWRHADRLKELAEELAEDGRRTDLLEAYWDDYRANKDQSKDRDEVNEQDLKGPETDKAGDVMSNSHGRGGRPSLDQAQAKSLMPGPTQELSLHHPARSLPNMLETFGPLVYPIYKAALLRKRLLLLVQAPVELACNFVYNISIISNIPSALASIIPLEPLPIRLSPLFAVGVHDIDSLAVRGRPPISSARESDSANTTTTHYQTSEGWVACTTDDVLRHKSDLYDVLITLPHQTQNKEDSEWPRLQAADGRDLCANQRDVRRFRHLFKNLSARSAESKTPMLADDSDEDNLDDENAPLMISQVSETDEDTLTDLPADRMETVPWSVVAYNSFLWWASAGEKGAELEEEATHDNALFTAFDSGRSYTDMASSARPASIRSSTTGIMTDGTHNAPEMALIAYFHRLTVGIMEILANLVDDSEEDEAAEARERQARRSGDQTEKQPPPVVIDSEDISRMGLDPWSEGDRLFITQLLDLYWGRKAEIRGGHIDCCGIRIF